MPKSPYRPHVPHPDQVACIPDVSGNTINGLGETEFRRARPVYWRDPDTIPHGELQKWFYLNDPDNPAIGAARADRQKVLDLPYAEVSGEPQQQSAEDWTRQLTEYAGSLDLELFGIARLQPEWTFEGVELDYDWVIVIGVAHDYEEISRAPEPEAGGEVVRQYGRAAKATKDITNWIRERGWDAHPQAGPMASELLLIPPALAAGFGELGRHGSIINRDYGSSFRLAAVLTSIPLIPTPEAHYGVDDFCSRCQVCSNACPPEAIGPEKVPVRGTEKWYVDFDKCILFFNETFGCGICIAVCPWSIPGRGPRIIEQLARRAERLAGG
ncbi:4Fe-4S dicluster domain-containing protein [Elongatibacter sediminis]|uniref:4Fe-4S dicluster domain-containing protein n=1 Tax=Elongatibacter sediminis TaxID=3119006 RepID=A0AAW9R6C3_9GAMM